jgi:hypothetical protein
MRQTEFAIWTVVSSRCCTIRVAVTGNILFRSDLTRVPFLSQSHTRNVFQAFYAPKLPRRRSSQYHHVHQVRCRSSLVPVFIPSMQISSIHLFAHLLLWSFRESC